MTQLPTRNNKFISLVTMLALAACSIRGQSIAPPTSADSALQYLNQTGAGKIKHVVWIVQENRSFNDIFMGFPGAETASSGKLLERTPHQTQAGEPQGNVRHRSLGGGDVQRL